MSRKYILIPESDSNCQEIDAVRRDLVGWDINIFESVRDAEDI